MIDETLFEAEEKMEKAVEVAKEDFAGIRTGRAHPGMFQKLLVDYYGAPHPAAAARVRDARRRSQGPTTGRCARAAANARRRGRAKPRDSSTSACR